MSEPSYIVTARKYRPQVFSELIGQEHVAETLRNALQFDRLAHAYLFSGPRGVGKTTSARILAKAINCTTPLEDREHGEPCRACESCESFEQGRSLNIIEIDAASNNSVDDVRSLREKVTIPPQGALKKVYIIDEVHMLSNQAFNALLKTLEEPPPFVLFIFATTEPHKVLPTILSRCQRFDFRRISVLDGVEHLRHVCAQEGVEADDESLTLIARKGDGALRDMLSALDQSVALCDGRLIYSELALALGVIDLDRFFEVSGLFLDQNPAGVFKLVHELTRSGTDYPEFMGGLAEHWRHLLVARTLGETSLIESSQSVRDRYLEHADSFSETDLLHMLQLVSEAEVLIKSSANPRLHLELALLKMVQYPGSVSINELIDRINAISSSPAGNDASGSKGNPPRGQKRRPAKPDRSASPEHIQTAATTEGSHPSEGKPVPTVSKPPKAAVEVPSAISTEQIPLPAVPDVEPAASSITNASRVASTDRPAPHPVLDEQLVDNSAPASRTDSEDIRETIFGTPALPKTGISHKPGASTTKAAEVPAVSENTFDTLDIPASGNYNKKSSTEEDQQFFAVKQAWTQVLEQIREARIHVHALLLHARPDHSADGQIALAVPDSFHVQMLSPQGSFIASKIQSLLELDSLPELVFFVDNSQQTGENQTAKKGFDPAEELKHLKQHNPALRALMDQFGAEIVW